MVRKPSFEIARKARFLAGGCAPQPSAVWAFGGLMEPMADGCGTEVERFMPLTLISPRPPTMPPSDR